MNRCWIFGFKAVIMLQHTVTGKSHKQFWLLKVTNKRDTNKEAVRLEQLLV